MNSDELLQATRLNNHALTMKNLEAFVSAYIVCALWSSFDEDGQPLEAVYHFTDVAESAMESMRKDCADFIQNNAADLDEFIKRFSVAQAGHDFWLTRNGHGAGFWDRGAGEIGERLSEAARVYVSCDIYAGDDGKLYVGKGSNP